MNLIINHSSMEPIYEQLSRQFRALISTGQMKEGERFLRCVLWPKS